MYKKYLRNNHTHVLEHGTDEDKFIVKNMDCNPRLLLILDDCVSSGANELNKAITSIFFEGRHRYITLIIATQQDTKINKGLRDNAYISIFCTLPVASKVLKKMDLGSDLLKQYEK